LRSAWLPMPAGTVVTIIRTIDIGAPLDPKLTSPDELWSRRQGSLGLYLFWLLSWRHFHNCKAVLFGGYWSLLTTSCGPYDGAHRLALFKPHETGYHNNT
jgi:hypothetical protein